MALTMVGLLTFLALAIDLGMLAIAKTQSQNAADLAALTAARTLNGNSTSVNNSGAYNNSTATANAQTVLAYNNILGASIQSSQLTLTYGSYDYSQTNQSFSANYPPTTGVPWTAVAATVNTTSLPGAFSNVLGNSLLPNVTATAQAVHRPRDIAMIMDLSESMRFGTLLGFDFPTTTRNTNNMDTNVPTFGQYSGGNAAANLYTTNATSTSATDSYTLTSTNTTATTSSYSLTYINSFYQNAAYATTLVRAFDSYTSSNSGSSWTAPSGTATPSLPTSGQYTSTPGGDVPLYQSGSTSNYAQTLNQVLGNSSSSTGATGSGYNIFWELDGYSAYAGGKPDTSHSGSTPQVWYQADYSANASSPANNSLPFNGYTQGPGYYGKTFFLWPPDPRNNQNTIGATTVSGTTLQNYLAGLGISTTKKTGQTQTDAVTLAAAWGSTSSGWLSQGATGLAYLRSWLNGGTDWVTGTTYTNAQTGAAYSAYYNYYSNSTLIYVPTTSGNGTTQTTGYWPGTWNGSTVSAANMPSTYNAVCRFFNRAYPCGAGQTSTSVSADWRVRFFGTDKDNTVIFSSNGTLNPPGTSGMWPSASSTTASTLLTYNAILVWLNQAPNPFPSTMRSGRIKYYGTMPSGTSSGAITGSWPNYGDTGSSHDQRFWIEELDHMLGFRQTAANSYTDYCGWQKSSTNGATNQMIGYGGDILWGTEATNSIPSSSLTTPFPYMSYQDNPMRPLLRCWFGPLLMVDYMHNCNMYENSVSGWYHMQPGNAYEAPLYVCKQAFAAAISTMENNHPNDWFAMMNYSEPRQNATDTSGRFNCVSCPLGTNYAYAQSSLLFPFSTINTDGSCNNTEVTPYDADPSTSAIPSSNFVDTPRAGGDTCFAMGLMLAYNQFAVTPSSDTVLRTYVTNSPITFPTGMAGGLGRNGAQKVVIFETDGIANCYASTGSSSTSNPTLTTNGSYNYYAVRYNMNSPSGSEYPSVNPSTITDSGVMTQVNNIVSAMASKYGTTRNPFRLYAIGFGPVFSGTDATLATGNLVSMQNAANSTSITSLPSNQVITGTDTVMSANMISAYTSILENGVQIALIQ
jgi:hypothetical protein